MLERHVIHQNRGFSRWEAQISERLFILSTNERNNDMDTILEFRKQCRKRKMFFY